MTLKIFMIEKIPKASSDYTCLAVISIYPAVKKDENYYPQAFIIELKYIEKEKK